MCLNVGNKEHSAVPGSVRWTAPEVLSYPTADEYTHPDIFIPAIDVYSFSMVLWEVSSFTEPFEDIPDNEVSTCHGCHQSSGL